MNKMNDFFIELIKNKFSVHLLENQIDGMNGIQKKEYLNFVMNGFEKREIFYWLKIFKAFEETGKLYLFDEDFPSDYFGTMGFYIENPDEIETTFDMITEISLNEFINQCNRLLKYDIKNISSIEKTNIEAQPTSFDELFYETEHIENFIDILKDVEPSLIDTDCNFIGKSKGAICVWIDELQVQGFVKRYSDRKIFAELITQKIKRFSIDESMFGKRHKTAENKYRQDFKTLISKIKLSQNSQKGKLGK
jgi:hypothetical protein